MRPSSSSPQCFVATCRLWAASGGVHALLVLEPTECSTSTRIGA